MDLIRVGFVLGIGNIVVKIKEIIFDLREFYK